MAATGIRWSMPVRISFATVTSLKLTHHARLINRGLKQMGESGDACGTSTAAARRPGTCVPCGGGAAGERVRAHRV
jgi:hypothetical protein